MSDNIAFDYSYCYHIEHNCPCICISSLFLAISHAIGRVIDPNGLIEGCVFQLIDYIQVLLVVQGYDLPFFTLNNPSITALPVRPARCK